MTLASRIRALVAGGTLLATALGCATTTGNAPYDQTYLSASHNWAFRKRFPDMDGLLNAFDYGHAALYQTLITHPESAAARQLDDEEFRFITGKLLPNPPDVPLDEGAIGPEFAKLAPEVLAMFDWAHMLHRQLYDVWSAQGLTDAERNAGSAKLVAYYRSRRDLAFSTKPKSMDLMEAQPYSLVFRREAPRYNGLLWSYHWFQLALYDALLSAHTDGERRAGMDSVKRDFFTMIADAPSHMPAAMPMAPMVAPRLSERYPDAAIIFDNLHALHDVVSDILMSPAIAADAKRTALLQAAAAYRDDTTAVISMGEWRAMARMPARTGR